MSDERLLETFFDLVRIPSPTFKEGDVARHVAAVLEDAGARVAFDESAAKTGSDTGNLLAELPGNAPGRTVLLSAHMDTVEPCEGVEPVVEDGVIRSSGDTVLGADDKAGVAAIVEVVRRLAESDAPRPPVRVVLTVAEEKGLVGAKALDPTDLAADVALVLDADGDPGGIVVASPTHCTFSATFHGHAAHAGVDPEKGRSAVVMAARAAATMPCGRVDAESTANVGTIQGGTATNVIAQTAVVTGECRSLDPERVEEIRKRMQRAMEDAAEALEGRVDVAWTKEYEAFHFAEDDPAVELVEAACRDIGIEPRLVKTGGGSDGNILHAKGIPTLVLSSGMRSVHGVDEWMRVEDLYTLARLTEAVVRRSVD